ncbi:imelysin family protein [Photobacterium swingsii]|uniref:imelysin family protein n=1 Tax=Photobacterium swingsii TaxID=680026 RepID=UPI004067F517
MKVSIYHSKYQTKKQNKLCTTHRIKHRVRLQGVCNAVVVVGLIMLTGCQQEQQTMSDAVHQLHVTSAANFAQQANQLDQDFQLYCQSPTAGTLSQAKEQWSTTMQAWMALQGREKGSEAALGLSWQIQFWPDKKNTTGRKLNQLLKQETMWQAAALANQSVAVQGLGAAEWFLYDQQSPIVQSKLSEYDKAAQVDKISAENCSLFTAVSGRIADSSAALEQAWKVNPWQSLPVKMALGEYLGALNNQLDYTMKKLSRPLGKPGSPKVYQAESWRSQTSMVNLKSNITAMQQLYLANESGLDKLLRDRGYAATADRIDKRFSALLEGWPQTPAMVPMLKTREGYRQLLNIYNGLEYIQIALQDEVAPELGIVVGFNATDGD